MTSQRIAIVGSGIAGMAAAWLLAQRHSVVVYEAQDRLGGHTNTVIVDDPGGPTPVDTGFIVYNEVNYPHLTALFRTLGVATRITEMTFSVSRDEGRMEYAGTSLNGLFGQRSNLLRPGFYRMLTDILRFNNAARRLARTGGDESLPLGRFLDDIGVGREMRDDYLLPMAAAVWSCPPRAMLDFPALSLARFYDNHGLLNINDRPQWRTVQGGSIEYVRAISKRFSSTLRLGAAVRSVESRAADVVVTDSQGHEDSFDQVVIAAHADEACGMLPPGDPRSELLRTIPYESNRVLLHHDTRLMPRRRRIWSAWNYLAQGSGEGNGVGNGDDDRVSVSYWMNCLQHLECERHYMVSLNPFNEPDPASVVAEFNYHHPAFSADAMAAQRDLPAHNGKGGIWLAGSYLGYGFHEDALRSAVAVARGLGVTAPWEESASSNYDAAAAAVFA